MARAYDFAIVGAGIAGASLAAQLAGKAQVIVLEAEERPGYHTTGRSAAFWTESYGGPAVQPLTAASGPALREGGFLTRREALTIGRASDEARIERFIKRYSTLGVEVERLGKAALQRRVPGLRPDWVCGALEPSCCDIDVAALHQQYLSTARKGGVEVWNRARLDAADRDGNGWQLALEDGRTLRSSVLVDAAGAWADSVAQRAGVRPLGIVPLRRTIVQLQVSPPVPPELPLVLDVNGSFYFKPESGRLWLSPHDETPSPACDAVPEEIDVALSIDRLQRVVDWQVERIEHRWAGLRSFAPDRLPVYGFDRAVPRFFWFAGQGGFGIQTAPAAACLAAGLLLGEGGGDIDPAPFSPARFG